MTTIRIPKSATILLRKDGPSIVERIEMVEIELNETSVAVLMKGLGTAPEEVIAATINVPA